MTVIDRSSLVTYLNDHLAGSIAALELMERISSWHAGTPLGVTMAGLVDEIGKEQTLIRSLVGAVGGSESTFAKSLAWLGEKVARIKIGPGEGDPSGLMLFEALEALSIGFWGRRSLWRALDHLGLQRSLDVDADFAGLARRAEQHLGNLEVFRLEASRSALMETEPVVTGRARLDDAIEKSLPASDAPSTRIA